MSEKYEFGDTIPSDVLVNRLNDLATAVTKGEQGMREFYMSIPARLDHDADIVIAEAARRIENPPPPPWALALGKAIKHIKHMPCIFALLGEEQTDEEGNPTECTCAGCVARAAWDVIPPHIQKIIEEKQS